MVECKPPKKLTIDLQGTDCDAYANSNSGCQTIDTSQASYGTEFNVLKGGVFAMMWANDGIRVCEYRVCILGRFLLRLVQGFSTELQSQQISRKTYRNPITGESLWHSFRTTFAPQIQSSMIIK